MENLKIIEQIDDNELERFDRLFSIPVILFDENKILYMNDSCIDMLGYLKEELPGMDFSTVAQVFDVSIPSSEIMKAINNRVDLLKMELSILGKNHNRLWVEFSGKVVTYHSRSCILASIVDITDKKKIELDLTRVSRVRALMLELTQSILKTEDVHEMFQMILMNALKAVRNSSLGTILVLDSNKITVASSIGYGDAIKDFSISLEEAFLFRATNGKMDRIVNIPDLLVYDKYHQIDTNFGSHIYIKSTITAPIYINGSLYGMINIDSVETNSFDEDDVKSMEFIRNSIEIALSNHLKYTEKAYMARYDHLTHLYNRFYLEEQFELIKEKALRYDESFSVVMFDINGLKTINDSYGHLVGDKVIRKIAGVLLRDTRKSDILARLGGDEFIGIFFHSNTDTLREKCLTLLSRLESEPVYVNNSKVNCSFSFGISRFPDEGRNLDELISLADQRMYTFKKSKG